MGPGGRIFVVPFGTKTTAVVINELINLKIRSLVSLGEWLDSSALCSLNACACISLPRSLRSRRRIFKAKEEI